MTAPSPKVNTSAATPAEKRQFATMRKFFDYYKGMKDDELRKQPLPPGVKNWDDVVGIATALNLLPDFVPPPTNATPGAGEASAVPDPTPTSLASPLTYDEPDGTHAMAFTVAGGTLLGVRWKDGDANAIVTYKPLNAAKPEDPGKTFEVPYQEDRPKFIHEILAAYVRAMAKNGDTPPVVDPPSPGP
jgi:hypothetical protein